MSSDAQPGISQLLRPYLSLSTLAEQQVDKNSSLISLAQNTLALHKGDSIAGAYVVLKGRLRVFCYSARGTEATLYMINPGETCVFALNALFKKLRYPAWVGADVETELVVINGDTFQSLFRKEPAVQDLTVNALSTSVFRLMQEMEQLQAWNLKQRLVNFLLNIASSEGVVNLTQQQISNHLGTTREVTARLLGELSSREWISTGRGQISLSDSRALCELLLE